MAGRFDGFVIFAGMRTGSNLLESTLNSVEGVTCHGEAFNPAFIGWPRRSELLGLTLDQREADPRALLDRIRNAVGMNGFRYFDDHDPRVFDAVAEDPRWAKIVLSRNPLDSYLSLKIARQTGQWKLGDLRNRREGQATFNAAEFESHVAAAQDFRLRLSHALQRSGQCGFWIDYEDLQDLAVLNGVLRFLGVGRDIVALPEGLVPQNPGSPEEKTENPKAMAAALSRLDWFNLSRPVQFEPRRGPSVPGFVALQGDGLLYQPIRCGPEAEVRGWLAGIGSLAEGMTQKDLRQWLRAHPQHRAFTVLRHPLARAHAAFCDLILSGRFGEIRDVLHRQFKLPMDDGMDEARHHAAFLAFLRWLKGNLNAQTGIRVDAGWASQSATIAGFSQVAPPDLVAREDRLDEDLDYLARSLGLTAPRFKATAPDLRLAAISDRSLDMAVREAYARDFAAFGFEYWQPPS